jgi:hypothetical protein
MNGKGVVVIDERKLLNLNFFMPPPPPGVIKKNIKS